MAEGLKKLKGFTLAEVLITLGIIGVVAALTIPTLISNYQKEQTVTKLKKAYTTMAQVVKRSEIDNGSNRYWDWGTDATTVKQSFETYWAPYLKVLRYCNLYSTCGYKTNIIKQLSGMDYLSVTNADRTTSILSDGTALIVGDSLKLVIIDINASKNPNVLGKDIFLFVLDEYKGLVPRGYDLNSTAINNDCKKNIVGRYCAAKIIMDNWQIKDDYPWP